MTNEQQLREALKNLLTAIQETPATDEAQAEQQNARISLAVLRAESLVSSWDADSGDACGDGWCYTNGGEIPCPKCNAEAHAEYCREDDEYQSDIQAAAGGLTQTALEC